MVPFGMHLSSTHIPCTLRDNATSETVCAYAAGQQSTTAHRGRKSIFSERLIRSRERNRLHAQKTRLRKKEQMLTLKARAADLKDEQIRLRQLINEKHTATILVRLFAEGSSPETIESCNVEDPSVEELLRRPVDEVPDSSQIPELPALILPGHHASKKVLAKNVDSQSSSSDGIDYELLGRDRSQCSPEELDCIRRERNRMHAKRTRDRKRIYTEKLSELCRQLEDENIVLHEYTKKIDPNYVYTPPPRTCLATPPSTQPSPGSSAADSTSTGSFNRSYDDQIASLLQAAERELHEISDSASSCCSQNEQEPAPKKSKRIPNSIALSDLQK